MCTTSFNTQQDYIHPTGRICVFHGPQTDPFSNKQRYEIAFYNRYEIRSLCGTICSFKYDADSFYSLEGLSI